MTDNEIIKAFEHLVKNANNHIPITGKMLLEDVLDVLNRKNAEIERLQEDYSFSIKLNGLLQAQRDGRDKLINELDEKIEKLNRALLTAESEAIKEFTKKINPIIEELVDIMFDGNESKCRISNCHKHSSIPCDSPTCIEENKAYWKLKIYNLVKEMVGDDNA